MLPESVDVIAVASHLEAKREHTPCFLKHRRMRASIWVLSPELPKTMMQFQIWAAHVSKVSHSFILPSF